MVHGTTPWIGLIALVAMFVLPYVPNWLFEGPRTIRHRPRRHVCADCGAPWTDSHECLTERPLGLETLRGELRRVERSAELVRRPSPMQSPEADY
jgi:hypothetical protein